MDPLRRLPVLRRGRELHHYVDPAKDEHLILELDLTRHPGDEVLRKRGDVARLQGASEGPEQSAARGADHVVEVVA